MMVNTMNAPLPLALAYDAQRDGTFVWVLRNFFSGLFSNSESYDREVTVCCGGNELSSSGQYIMIQPQAIVKCRWDNVTLSGTHQF